RRQLSSCACESPPSPPQAESAKAHPKGNATRCCCDCCLERATLASTKKKAEQEQQTIVFVDQSAFYLLPMAVYTSAPVGQTPVLKVKLTRDHLSAMGGMTPEGRIFMQMQDHSYKGPDVVRFLQLLTREISGKLLVIWDG